MQCPKCQGKTRPYATKPLDTIKMRYRICMMCGHKFKTWEEPDKAKLRKYKKRSAQSTLFGDDT